MNAEIILKYAEYRRNLNVRRRWATRKNAIRDNDILQKFYQGVSKQALSNEYNISAGRIGQIIKISDVKSREEVRVRLW